jgi:hypothetical protein
MRALSDYRLIRSPFKSKMRVQNIWPLIRDADKTMIL